MEPVTLRMPRWKMFLAGGFFALCTAVFLMPEVRADMLAEEPLTYWFCLFASLAFVAISAVVIFIQPTLTLDADGFEHKALSKMTRVNWTDTGPLSLYSFKLKGTTTATIVYDGPNAGTPSKMQTANRALTGHTDGIPVQFGLKPMEQLDLMIRYREAALNANPVGSGT